MKRLKRKRLIIYAQLTKIYLIHPTPEEVRMWASNEANMEATMAVRMEVDRVLIKAWSRLTLNNPFIVLLLMLAENLKIGMLHKAISY